MGSFKEKWIFSMKSIFLLVGCLVCFGEVKSYEDDYHGSSPVTGSTFDYIVVGGGVGGCTVASRLSESGQHSVLLLEAGGVPPQEMEIPAYAERFEQDASVTFQFRSVPQTKFSLSDNGGVIKVPLGKVLGGTSQINHQVHNRGSPLDFDNWANITGDSSWKYENLLKYFRKAETYMGEFPSAIHHGFSGPNPVSYQKFAPGREPWLAAGRELGFPIKDPNGPQESHSFTPMEFSRKFGRRQSSYRNFIEPFVGVRPNLKVITHAYATELIFGDDNKTVLGVKYNSNGTNPRWGIAVFSQKEVILSAGTYGSAMILMRSGVGPRDVLYSAGILQRKELPVGENFHDHPELPIHIMLNNKSVSYTPEIALNPINLEIWRRYGTGPYSSSLGYSGQTFLTSTISQREDGRSDWSDMQICMAARNKLRAPFRGNYIAPWETSIQMNVYVGRPYSRGSVKLNPSDPLGEPIIDFNFLGDKRDEDILQEIIHTTLNIFETTDVYKKLGARIFKEPVPACRHFRFRSDEYWRCYTHHVSFAGNHPVGTCSMGSVVDSKLRVIGLHNVRVVDGGIMPVITNSNLHAAIYGIAEKASDDILQENRPVETTTANVVSGLGWHQ